MPTRSRVASLTLACAIASLLAPSQTLASPKATPDPAFGGDGSLVADIPVTVTDATLDPEGRIVLGGIRFGQPAVARLLPDGSPDTTFGFDGDGEVHEGSVNGAQDVKVEAQTDGSIRALVSVPDEANGYLRVDFAPSGAQTGAVRFAGSAGVADFTANGGAVTSAVDDQIVARQYGFLGAEDLAFQPEPEPATRCQSEGFRCLFYAPTELAVNAKGTVVRSIKTINSFSSCDGSETVTSLPPEATKFAAPEAFTGCGISEVFSIDTDPRGRFLVAGWGAPPATAEFVRYTKRGEIDTRFGDDGTAIGPKLSTDNLLLPDPAFGGRGAFFTAFTQPRTPTLGLRPVRFSASGRFSQPFDNHSRQVTFTAADGITDFDPAVTLRLGDKRIVITGTGQTESGPVPAFASWRTP